MGRLAFVPMAVIEIQDVHKRFGGGSKAVEALRGVSLEVREGEVFGLLGRNGAGKTTLVKILLDMVRPSQGTTRILGEPSTSVKVRRRIGYLPEGHLFPEYRTARGVMHFYAALSGMSGRERRRKVPDALERVGLADAAGRKVRHFSKGMKQRLGLAQALLHDPQVVLLDEPTDGVDPVGRAEIRLTLERLRAEGRTLFVNSHLLSEVEQISDRVAILDGGRVARIGSLDELTAGERRYRLSTDPLVTEEVVQRLRRIALSVERVEQSIELVLRNDSDLDPIFDLLRETGFRVRGLVSQRLTLEQVFLQAVQPPAPEPEPALA